MGILCFGDTRGEFILDRSRNFGAQQLHAAGTQKRHDGDDQHNNTDTAQHILAIFFIPDANIKKIAKICRAGFP